MMTPTQDTPEPIGEGKLSIAVIGPDSRRRHALAGALEAWKLGDLKDSERHGFVAEIVIRQFGAYPGDLDELPLMLDQHYDIVFVDLDSDPDYAFDLVESICVSNVSSVMVYSEQSDLQLAVRSMRAGAREFLTLPFATTELADALARASIRSSGSPTARKATKKVFVFLGVKGGCGVTTLATNFAVSLAQESGQSTLLIDMGLPLGDAAINLGMTVRYSTEDAFQDSSRLDASFLSSLLAKHTSGLFVLAAPAEIPSSKLPHDAFDKLLVIARQNFNYVVVDAGSRLDLKDTLLFDESSTIYLITQAGVSELRNSNRLISRFFAKRAAKLQIVLNRFIPQSLGLDEAQIVSALTRMVDWRIPDDYANARRTQITATALAMKDSPISRAIRQMARTACGLPANKPKKKQFSFFS
jgi:pilus assembly protein CpaE